MYHHYKLALFLVTLAIPFAVVVLGNRFDSAPRTFVRIFVAAMLTWGWNIAIRVIVSEVDVKLAESPEELQQIYNGDGAKNAFAAFFGWIPGLFLAMLYWLLARAVLFVKLRRNMTDAAR